MSEENNKQDLPLQIVIIMFLVRHIHPLRNNEGSALYTIF